MAFRRLYNTVRGIGNDPSALRNDQATSVEATLLAKGGGSDVEGAFVAQGVVQAVSDRSGAMVQFRGLLVQAGQATDEPLRAGQRVWISRTKTGTYVIHGSIK